MFLYNNRLKFAVGVSWSIYLHLAKARFDCLLRMTISGIAALLVLPVVLGIAKFVVHLCLKCFLKQILELRYQSISNAVCILQIVLFQELSCLLSCKQLSHFTYTSITDISNNYLLYQLWSFSRINYNPTKKKDDFPKILHFLQISGSNRINFSWHYCFNNNINKARVFYHTKIFH